MPYDPDPIRSATCSIGKSTSSSRLDTILSSSDAVDLSAVVMDLVVIDTCWLR